MTSRIAQALRGLSLTASLESDVEASTVTGDGEQTVVAAVEEAQAVPADGEAAPGEDQEVTATVVEVAEGAETETAETVATDSEVVASTESDTTEEAAPAAEGEAGEAVAETTEQDTTTGDGEQVVTAEVEAAQEVPADGAGAPGEDAEVTATIVEVAEGAETETAETEVSGDETVSQEGLGGGLLGFLAGGAGWAPFIGAGIHAAAKAKRIKMRQDIETIAKRIDTIRKGDVKKAATDGVELPSKIKDLDWFEILKSAILGQFFGAFYGARQGSELQDLNNELRAKLRELKKELDAAGVAYESFEEPAVEGETETTAPAEGEVAADGEQAVEVETPAEPVVDEVVAGEEAAPAAEEVAETISVDEAANAAAVAAAEGVAQGAAAAAEAAAAAVAEVTGEAEVETTEQDAAADDTAIAEGDAEIEELEEAIAEGEEHVEEYEQASATLESLVEALEDAQKTGGLTPQSARFFNIGFESIGVRLTGKPFTNGHGEACVPSLESFGGSMRRDTATQISMEAAQDWLKKIWEVLKRTYAQVKEWLVKFVKAVFDQSERYAQRAAKIKAAAGEAAKNGKTTAKSDKVDIGATAGKIAVGQSVSSSVPAELTAFVKEAATRGTDGTRALIQLRENLKKIVAEAAQGKEVNVADSGIAEAGQAGDLRSAVFSIPEGDSFKTKNLPGNVEFVSINPASSHSATFLSTFRGWKVEERKGDVEVNGEQKTLSLTEIAGIAGEVIKLIEAAKVAKDSLKEEALSITDIAIPDDVSDDARASIRASALILSKTIQWQSGSIGKMLKYAVATSGYYLDYAAASLKQYGAAAPAAAALPAA